MRTRQALALVASATAALTAANGTASADVEPYPPTGPAASPKPAPPGRSGTRRPASAAPGTCGVLAPQLIGPNIEAALQIDNGSGWKAGRCPSGNLTVLATADGTHWKRFGQVPLSTPPKSIIPFAKPCFPGQWTYMSAFVSTDQVYKSFSPTAQWTCPLPQANGFR